MSSVDARLEYLRTKLRRRLPILRDDLVWLLRQYDALAASTRALADEIDRAHRHVYATRRGRLLAWVLKRGSAA